MMYRRATVTRIQTVTPTMRRITLSGDELKTVVDAGPDQYVKLFLPASGHSTPQLPPPPSWEEPTSWYRTYLTMPDAIRPPMRTYTIRGLRPKSGEVDIDFVLHGDTGPATRWANHAQPGDEVAFMGPHGLYSVPSTATWQLLVGDETAVPAISAIVENAPADAHIRAFIEVQNDDERQPFDLADDIDIQWIRRGEAAHGHKLVEAIRATALPTGQPYAWVSGEAGMVKTVRRHLVSERGFDKKSITFTGYWRQGKTELDAGKEWLRETESDLLTAAG